MTNLMIGYPQITTGATITTSAAYATTAPKENVISGPRAMYGELSAAGISNWCKAALGASTQKTIDFLFIARANIAKAMGSTRLLLDGSNDDAAYTNICGVTASVSSLTLYGPRQEDALFTSELANSTAGTLSASPTWKYWRTWVAGTADPSKKYPFSKTIFGAWFDMGRDPESREIEPRAEVWDRESRLIFRLTWSGITSTVKDSVISTLIDKRENGCILYTRTYHDALNEHRVIHCQIVEWIPQVRTEGTYNLTLVFEEMI